MDEDGHQSIRGISSHKVDGLEKVSEILNRGRQNRSVASTALNDHSSRSHAIATITVKMRDLTSGNVSIGSVSVFQFHVQKIQAN